MHWGTAVSFFFRYQTDFGNKKLHWATISSTESKNILIEIANALIFSLSRTLCSRCRAS